MAITVRIIGGPSTSVPWAQNMTALQAMEQAHALIEPDPNEQFTYALQFYGQGLGYLVCMINETYDSFISRGGEKATPFYYWQFLINAKEADLSVDRKVLNDGDDVSFEFKRYEHEAHRHTLLGAKHQQQTG